MAEPDLISVAEAGRRLGVSSNTMYRWIRDDRPPFVIRAGGRWKVSVPRLERFLTSPSGRLVPQTLRDSVHRASASEAC